MSDVFSKMTIVVREEDRQYIANHVMWGFRKPLFIIVVREIVEALKKAGPEALEALVLGELKLRDISPLLRKAEKHESA